MTAPVEVLIVDDLPQNHLALEVVLQDLEGVKLVGATSGRDALRLLLHREFAVIILDVQMPDMDGFETAELIRNSERTRHIPIIFLTANGDVNRGQGAYARGAVDYMVKPFVPEMLRAKVAVFVELHRKNRHIVEMERRNQEQRLAHERAVWEAELFRTKLEQERTAAATLSEANERLRAALAARDEFMQMASHELKTPLTSMQLAIDGFMRRLRTSPGADAEKVRTSLGFLQTQLSRLGTLVEQMLNVVTIDGGQLRIVPQAMDLVEVAKQAADDLQQMANRAGCAIDLHVEGPVLGTWDPFWVRQAIGNLLSNAFKFGAGNRIDLIVGCEAGQACVSVCDRGIGIAEEDHARIFERFERAVSRDNYGGLGLGLHIVKHITERHGGTVRVVSTKGKGATFTLHLPQREGSPRTPASPPVTVQAAPAKS